MIKQKGTLWLWLERLWGRKGKMWVEMAGGGARSEVAGGREQGGRGSAPRDT